jgi:transmembrane sensor
VERDRAETLPQAIKAEAAAWLARLHSDTRDAADEAGFRAWLAEDARHAQALEQVTAAWDAVGGLGPQLQLARSRNRPSSRRSVLVGGTAATLAIGALFAWRSASRPVTYATVTGEQRRIALADGSSIMLDTNSVVRVAMRRDRRRIELVHGRAHFDVAHDRSRPFVVHAGDHEVVAVGTAFDVARSSGRVAVVLMNGRVVVRRSAAAASASAEVMRPGERLVFQPPRVVRDRPNFAQVTAWQSGRAIFDNQPLGEAVMEMNAYNRRPIVVGDAALAATHVSGVYRTGDTEAFARSLAALLPAAVQVTPTRIVLTAVDTNSAPSR